MRTIATSSAGLALLPDRAVHVRVTVSDDDPVNEWVVDLSQHVGENWVIGAEWGEATDNPLATATITLHRDIWRKSLCPDLTNQANWNSVTNTAASVLREGKSVTIYVQIAPLGSAPTSYLGSDQWIEAFDGYIDSIDIGSNESPTITLHCRDLGAKLQDYFIESERPLAQTNPSYAGDWWTGLTWPRSLETYIQNILDNTIGGVTLNVIDASTWNLNKPAADNAITKEPLLDLLRRLANSIGYDVRYKWAGSFQFSLFNPNRSYTTYAVQFPQSFVHVDSLTRSIEQVRNRIAVEYSDYASGYQRKTITLNDTDSQSRYGIRFAEIVAASNSNIDTATEVDKLANAVLNDYSRPKYQVAVSMPCYPWLELNDAFDLPDGVRLWDSDRAFSVISVKHTVSGGRGRTTVTGKEIDIVNQIAPYYGDFWTQQICYPGLAKANLFNVPSACLMSVYDASGGNTTFTAGGTRYTVNYDTVALDKHGDFDGVNKFTAPFDGNYQITGSIGFPSLAAGTTVENVIYAGGVYHVQTTKMAKPEAITVSQSLTVFLQAGQTVLLQGSQDSASAVTSVGGQAKTFLAVQRVV